ncbi:MAG: efflux transporter periplasmic adaptor subunit [Coxiella sp. RIFCSPHIGHO2_12_FULL_42_15]|nr:MAG: efflux transporter periplasmic adaptor subunit [Coxiella sp. RIFCSPHIGHO2_12_FULL_42_15]
MKKIMSIMLVCVLVFFGGVFAWKAFVLHEEKKMSMEFKNPIITISAVAASTLEWDPTLQAVGSTRTVKGVNVTTELAGMITDIPFTPGANVKKGDVLVRLNIAPEVAQLHQLEAQAKLAKITYERDKKQFSFGAVSKEQLDTDDANMESTKASVEQEQATIDKKIIRAPFTGKLGISAVNPGEYINSGQTIVSLQTLDPIFVDFYLPQQDMQNAAVGQSVEVTSDRVPGQKFIGKITTINPIVNTDIRNVEVEATLSNPKAVLLPGMFTNVQLNTGSGKKEITLPEMAITFNPYGALVYLLQKTDQMHDGKAVWKAEQQFVTTGKTRGNQIAVLKGIKEGDMVVTSGQLKLKNGSLVVIDNTAVPSDNPNPPVKDRS